MEGYTLMEEALTALALGYLILVFLCLVALWRILK